MHDFISTCFVYKTTPIKIQKVNKYTWVQSTSLTQKSMKRINLYYLDNDNIEDVVVLLTANLESWKL